MTTRRGRQATGKPRFQTHNYNNARCIATGVMVYVLPNGADVEIEGYDETLVYDRIEVTESGMVVCINKSGYQMDCYPQERIESMHTFTEHVEDEDWW